VRFFLLFCVVCFCVSLTCSNLAKDFCIVAQTYGRIIITEHFACEQQIKPKSLGGVAGGQKYSMRCDELDAILLFSLLIPCCAFD
jgi:hypothetical protein